jgi:hypothetical protein
MQTNSGIANSGSGAATSSSAARASVPRDDHPTAISETATYAFVAWLTSIFGYCEYIKDFCGVADNHATFYVILCYFSDFSSVGSHSGFGAAKLGHHILP